MTHQHDGWKIRLDPRSRRYGVGDRGSPRSYTWACGLHLDQGQQGACTGFAAAHCAAARPHSKTGLSEAQALEVYRRALVIDEWPGEDYEGTSVLAAMKAAVEKGFFQSYWWAFSEPELAGGIFSLGPAVLGLPWYEGMDHPNPTDGVVHATGPSVGGHAILCRGFNYRTGLYRLHNSWGASWGKGGDCFVSRLTMARLIEEGSEICFPSRRPRQ